MNYTKETLGNGIRVVTVGLPHLSTVSLVLYVRAGSRFESRATNGLSHFLEHMLFRGTKSYADSYDLNLAMERLGGLLNGSTSRDDCFYDTALPPESLAAGIAILGEMAATPRMAKLATERSAVLEEILADFDEEGQLVDIDQLAHQTIFPEHALGFPICGPARNVETFDRDDVYAHHQRFYCGRNLVLCAVGPVDPVEVRAAAEAALGAVPAGVESTVVPAPARAARRPSLTLCDTHGSQVALRCTFPLFEESHPDIPAAALLLRILDDGISSRLHRRIYDDLGLAYEVSAGVETFADTGLFDLEATVAPAKVPALLRELLAIGDELAASPPAADELDKAKTRHRLHVRQMQDDSGALAGWYGGTQLYREPEPLAARGERVQAVTAEDVQRVAGKVFARAGLVVTAVGPVKSKAWKECGKIAEG